MYHLFVSHSSKDAQCAKAIVEFLEKRNMQCWIAPRDMPPGANQLWEIPQAIERCGAFLLLLSRDVCMSPWVELELSWAIRNRKFVIPLLLEEMDLTGRFAFALQNTQVHKIHAGCYEDVAEAVTGYLERRECFGGAICAGDPSDAAKWLRYGAYSGSAQAKKRLGDCYLHGDGVPVSFEQAFHWYAEASKAGLADAQYALAACYDFGYGVPEEAEQAAVYYLHAARQGHVSAQYCIASMYESGEGVERDHAEALRWYEQAAAQGGRTAVDQLAAL